MLDEEDMTFWLMLQRTIEDWLKLFGHEVKAGQQACVVPSASSAMELLVCRQRRL